MHFASEQPERLQSLILEDSGAEARPGRIEWIKKILHSAPTPFTSRESAKEYFETEYQSDPITGAFLHANLVAQENGTLDWRFHAAGMIETIEEGRAKDAMGLFCKIQTPTLIIRGEKSIEFTQEEAARMQECRSQNASLAIISDAGHLIHAEKPKEFTDSVEAFLDQTEPQLH